MTERYARQVMLPEVGGKGQRRLSLARIVVIGAGGLGCPVLSYLAGAGIGHIRLVDPDHVEVSNLHRQPIYGQGSLGEPKALAACAYLEDLNPDVEVLTWVERLDAGNVKQICEGSDLIFDCADSFAATYTLSDYGLEMNTPLVSASALATNGYVGGFCGGAPSVRAVFPKLPNSLATCASAGVLGPVVGMIGSLQAQMGLSILLDGEPSPLGQLISFKGQGLSFSSFRFDNASEPETGAFPFIAPSQISVSDHVIELRGLEEVSEPLRENADRKSVDDFKTAGCIAPSENSRTVLVCRSGVRAWRAAELLQQWWDGPIALVAAGTQSGESQ